MAWPRSIVLLVIRLAFGIQFFFAGLGKLQNHEKTVDFFTQIQIPAPEFHAWLVGGLECFGGVLLILGLATRLISIPLLVAMVVAYLTAHTNELKTLFSSDPSEFFSAPPFPFLIALLVLIAFGPGRIALDAFFKRCATSKRKIEEKPDLEGQKS